MELGTDSFYIALEIRFGNGEVFAWMGRMFRVGERRVAAGEQVVIVGRRLWTGKYGDCPGTLRNQESLRRLGISIPFFSLDSRIDGGVAFDLFLQQSQPMKPIFSMHLNLTVSLGYGRAVLCASTTWLHDVRMKPLKQGGTVI
jgi:hypothetical protein